MFSGPVFFAMFAMFATFAIFAIFAAAAAPPCGLATFGSADSDPLHLTALPLHRSLIDDRIESAPAAAERVA
jgi:hypothetical protein